MTDSDRPHGRFIFFFMSNTSLALIRDTKGSLAVVFSPTGLVNANNANFNQNCMV